MLSYGLFNSRYNFNTFIFYLSVSF